MMLPRGKFSKHKTMDQKFIRNHNRPCLHGNDCRKAEFLCDNGCITPLFVTILSWFSSWRDQCRGWWWCDQLKCSLINGSALISANVSEAGDYVTWHNGAGRPRTVSILNFIRWKKEMQFSSVVNWILMWSSKCFERNYCSHANKTGFVDPVWCQAQQLRHTKYLPWLILVHQWSLPARRVFLGSLNNSGIFHPHLPLNAIKLGCNYILSTYLAGTYWEFAFVIALSTRCALLICRIAINKTCLQVLPTGNQ